MIRIGLSLLAVAALTTVLGLVVAVFGLPLSRDNP